MTTRSRTEKLELAWPFEYNGVLIKEITIRRPKGSDMRFLPTGVAPSIDTMFPFFGLLAGIDEAIFDEMDAADIAAVGDIVNGFLSSERPKIHRRPAPGARSGTISR